MGNRETGADLDDLVLQVLVVESAPNQAPDCVKTH
jgi:hypothetical protein